jgi:DNA-directed RNA polymerase subunit RPC12/RpoP
MARKTENTGFVCAHCGHDVAPLTNGSYRNHCPRCLYSLHVDHVPGDRANGCGGLMRPVGVKLTRAKGCQVVHRCLSCGVVRVNRVAFLTKDPDSAGALGGLAAWQGR